MALRQGFLLKALLLSAFILNACGMAVPKGAYRIDPSSSQHQRLALSLYRAAVAAGEKPENYKLGMIRSAEINAASAGGGAFYFTDGLASQSQKVIDGVVAHEVAHEALGHVGQTIIVSTAISTLFRVLNTKVPGIGYADDLVNPLVTRGFGRSQEFAADRRAVEILRKMGYEEPERVMLSVLNDLRDRYGSSGGGLLSTHPNIDDRIVEIAKLQPIPSTSNVVAFTPPPPPPKAIPLETGGRIVVATLNGSIQAGTLEQANRGQYVIQTGNGPVSIDHADIAELRYYRQLTPEQHERARTLPLMRVRRVNGWESIGWVKELDKEMYEVVLRHDESKLFIRKTQVTSMVREATKP